MSGRVLIVASEFPPGPGGIGTQARELARHFSKAGLEVRVLAGQDYVSDRERADFNAAQPFSITRTTAARSAAVAGALRARQLRRELRGFRPDVVLASGSRSVWLCALLCPRASFPWVAVAHGTELSTGGRGSGSLTRWAFDRADLVVAVSRFTAERLTSLGVDPRQSMVIPNGGDDERFGPDERAGAAFRLRHGLGDAPVVLTVGNVTERKGQQIVVEALPQLVRSVPDVQYVVVGEPTEARALQDRAAALDVADRVHLLGRLEASELVAAYNACDVFAMTSTEAADGAVEGYGIAIVEAALCAKPAVGSCGSGTEEAISDGSTGRLAVMADPTSTAEALGAVLLGDSAQMGEAAREHALSGHTWAAVSARYRAALDRFLPQSFDEDPWVGGRMLVVSHTAHRQAADGTVVGFGPTVRELDHLATLVDELVHVAPLHQGEAAALDRPYEATNVEFVPVSPAGGDRLVDKVAIVPMVPGWVRTLWRQMGRATSIHVRGPASISLVALLLLAVRRRPAPRWFKYAGTWRPPTRDGLGYRAQRWLLRHDHPRGQVTVNGRWPGQRSHVHTFENPSLTDDELVVAAKVGRDKQLTDPYRLLFVGRLKEAKGVDMVMDVADALRAEGLDLSVDLVGDGPLAESCRQWARRGGDDRVWGTLPRVELDQRYAEAHILLLPSASEGFPKVVGEAMAFGVVPVCSDVGSLRQVLGEVGCGVVTDRDPATVASAVRDLLQDRQRWRRHSEAGIDGADRFSYVAHLRRVSGLLAQDRL